MHLGTSSQAVAQAPKAATAGQQKKSQAKRDWERPLPKSGWDFSMLVSRSMSRVQRAWGSICIPTGLGAVWINNVTVKRDDDGNMKTSLPFRAKPNRSEGGIGEMVQHRGESVYVVTGSKSYDNEVSGPGAMKASRLFMQAYDQCSQCQECRDVDPKKVISLIEERTAAAKVIADGDKSDEAIAKLVSIDNQIDRLNKRCYAKDHTWTVSGETNNGEGAEVNCTCSCFVPDTSESTEQGVENLAAMVNSVLDELTAPDVVEKPEDDDDTLDEPPY